MDNQLQPPKPRYRRLFVARSGNAYGVIDEPDVPDGIPEDKRADLWAVEIGLVDVELAMSSPYPSEDLGRVLEDLKDFLRAEGLM